MPEESEFWRDEEGVPHSVEYVDEDPIEMLPEALVTVLGTHLLSEPDEDSGEWLALDDYLAREIDGLLAEERTLIPQSREDEGSSILVTEVGRASRGLDNATKLRLLNAVRSLMGDWINLVGDPEKLAGHLLLAHLEPVDIPVEQALLIWRHFALHESAGTWGHGGD